MIRPAVALAAVALALMAGSLAFGFRDAPSQQQRTSLLYPRPARLSSLPLAELERWLVRALSHYRGAYRAHERVASRRALTEREFVHRRWFRRASLWTAKELRETRLRIRLREQMRGHRRLTPADVNDSCLSELIDRETAGTWDHTIWNGQGSGAYGLPQALPGKKMRSAGSDWRTNPWTQLRWMRGYVNARYGGSCAALAHQTARGYY